MGASPRGGGRVGGGGGVPPLPHQGHTQPHRRLVLDQRLVLFDKQPQSTTLTTQSTTQTGSLCGVVYLLDVLVKLTNRQSKFSSLSHESRAEKSQCERTLRRSKYTRVVYGDNK